MKVASPQGVLSNLLDFLLNVFPGRQARRRGVLLWGREYYCWISKGIDDWTAHPNQPWLWTDNSARLGERRWFPKCLARQTPSRVALGEISKDPPCGLGERSLESPHPPP